MERWWKIVPSLSVILLSFCIAESLAATSAGEGVAEKVSAKIHGRQAYFNAVAKQWLDGKHAARLNLKFSGTRQFDLKKFHIGVQGKLRCDSILDFSDAVRWTGSSPLEISVDLAALRWEGARSFGEWLATLQKRGGKLQFWIEAPATLTGAELSFSPASPYQIPAISKLQFDPASWYIQRSTIKASFQSTAPVSKFECRMDSAAWKVCQSPWVTHDVANGWHQAFVRGFSVDGRVGPAQAEWLYVYVPAPSVEIVKVAPLENPTTVTTKQITFKPAPAWLPFFNYFYQGHTECRLDGGAYRYCASPVRFEKLAAGEHVAEIRFVRSVWPWLFYMFYLGEPATYRWSVESGSQPVDLTWVKTPNEYSAAEQVSFEFKTNRSVETKCALDGQALTACTSPWDISSLNEGDHVARVEAWEQGVSKATQEFRWVTDLSAPVMQWSLLDPASSPTSRTSFSGQYVVDEPAVVVCYLDGKDLASCPNPFTIDSLGDGKHQLTVQATDRAAHLSVLKYDWEIDTRNPMLEVSLVQPLISPSMEKAAEVSFQADEDSSFVCILDEGTPFSCVSPWQLTELADGTHLFKVSAIDRAGNLSETKSVQWSVDTTAPSWISYRRTPAENPTISRSASLEFEANESTKYFCALNGGGLDPCTSPWVLNGLMDGEHAVEIQAQDPAGNTSKKQTDKWTVAATVVASIDDFSPAKTVSNQVTAKAEFSALGAIRFECRLDGGAWNICSSPWSNTAISNGSHRFEVRAYNALDEGGPIAARAWDVDTVAPVLTVGAIEPAGGLAGDGELKISFSTDKEANTFCRLDAVSWNVCSSPWQVSGLADGNHLAEIYAEDVLGNRSTIFSKTWSVDSVLPTVSWKNFSPLESVTTDRSFRAEFVGNKSGLTFSCALDSKAVACTSPWGMESLSDGTHRVTVTGSDVLNRQSSPISKIWSIDTVAPKVQITSATPPEKATTSRDMAIAFTASESAEFVCALDGAVAVSCKDKVTYTALADGMHTVAITAKDAAGNLSNAETYAWTVDTTAPVLRILSLFPSFTPTSQTSLTVTFDPGADAVKSFCSLDGAPAVVCTSPWGIASVADGDHKVDLYSQDAVGLKSTHVTYAWTVRTTALSIDSLAVTLVTKDSASVTWTTNLPATAQVGYGEGTVLDRLTALQPDYVTVHTVELTGLTPNTLYRARAISADRDNRKATSPQVSFRTLR